MSPAVPEIKSQGVSESADALAFCFSVGACQRNVRAGQSRLGEYFARYFDVTRQVHLASGRRCPIPRIACPSTPPHVRLVSVAHHFIAA